MPRLVLGALERGVEADLDDLVASAENGLAHGRDPRVAREFRKTPKGLGVDLHIPAARSSADGTAAALDGLPERRRDVLAHVLGPLSGEGAFAADDAVAVKRRHVFDDLG